MAMATITLEVPDEIAEWLEDWADELPSLLSSLAAEDTVSAPYAAWRNHGAWLEALEFFAGAPDVQTIVDFRLSSHLQGRLDELLDANAEDALTPREQVELDGYIQIIRFFNLLKASLRTTLN